MSDRVVSKGMAVIVLVALLAMASVVAAQGGGDRLRQQSRDQIMLQDCNAQDCDCVPDQLRLRAQDSLQDGEPDRLRLRDCDCDCDGVPDQLRLRDRTQDCLSGCEPVLLRQQLQVRLGR